MWSTGKERSWKQKGVLHEDMVKLNGEFEIEG